MPTLLALGLSLVLSSSAMPTRGPAGIERLVLQVNGANEDWTHTKLRVEAGDILLFDAAGQVRIGAFKGYVGAQGECGPARGWGCGDGHLVAKIGDGKDLAVGAHFYIRAPDSGPLKLKVYDTRYSDNDGAFTVTIIRIPGRLVQGPALAQDTDAE